MNAQEIYQHCLQHGGITYNLRNDTLVNNGFAVSCYPERERHFPMSSDGIERYISENYDILRTPAHYLGIWYDDGLWYFDVVVVMHQAQAAIDVALEHNQQAIFDLKSKTEIEV